MFFIINNNCNIVNIQWCPYNDIFKLLIRIAYFIEMFQLQKPHIRYHNLYISTNSIRPWDPQQPHRHLPPMEFQHLLHPPPCASIPSKVWILPQQRQHRLLQPRPHPNPARPLHRIQHGQHPHRQPGLLRKVHLPLRYAPTLSVPEQLPKQWCGWFPNDAASYWTY